MTTSTIDISELVLSEDQQKAQTAFVEFMMDKDETVFVLRGFAGCGKTTLVRYLLEKLPKLQKTIQMLDPERPVLETVLTATTNKAAENLAQLTGRKAQTIHSWLTLYVKRDYTTNEVTLQPQDRTRRKDYLLFIDEASYIDKKLLSTIFAMTENCKIVFIGDPAQLAPVKSSNTPVFDIPEVKGATLTQVVRQSEGNPIIDLATKFRHTVETGEFFSFTPDGVYVQHLPRDEFEKAIMAEFGRSDWKHRDSKVLAWTNKCVINYNNRIRENISGSPDFEVGDYAICNSYISPSRNRSISTDQLVYINRIYGPTRNLGVVGHFMTLDHEHEVFLPKNFQDKKRVMEELRTKDKYNEMRRVDNTWIDLRAAYACTINKSQGSTYDRVFIDLDDIARCNSGDLIARMLYVAVSRARHQVVFTGDLA